MVMITPAKWQAKDDELNQEFRNQIAPYIDKITFYPDCTDVFEIQDAGGIAYYNIDKDVHKQKEIVNICKLNKVLNDKELREIGYTLHNKGNTILDKIRYYKKYNPDNVTVKKHVVYTNNSISIGGKAHKEKDHNKTSRYTYLLSNIGMLNCISKSENTLSILERSVKDSKISFSSDDETECENFISWLETRFVRYLVFIGLVSRNGVISKHAFRFVPDPVNFDHIFTDEELYKKYNLTQEEIDIIESVIKERK